MLDIANSIKSDLIAPKEHVPNQYAVYILVNLNQGTCVEMNAQEFCENSDLKLKDYYSCVISTNKCIGGIRQIHSNNKYTMFVKDIKKINRDILSKYYQTLDCDALEYDKYIEWILQNKDTLSKHQNMIKIFFHASIDEYVDCGKGYFCNNIFANKTYTYVNENGEEMGLPLTINSNNKKPFLISAPTKTKCPYLFAKEDCYKIKCLLDVFRSLLAKGYNKAYFYDDTYIALKKHEISKKDIPPSIFIQFDFGKNGMIDILDWETIPCFYAHLWKKNILYYYLKLNELFFDEDLHNIINNLNATQLNRPSKNAQEKISLAPALNMWFIKGWYPGPQNINHIERQLVSILKKEIELDYDKSIQRILFIKEFLRCVKKQ